MKIYWDTLSKSEQNALAKRVGSSSGYLRLIFNGYKKAGFSLAKRIEEETNGKVTRCQLRPDIYGNSTVTAA
ncbi:YdaS family helix-turn-helix protein [Serratia marcescens]|uniref:YdaS family helix-turn-helix protein n=1 Tax=Serratia marcescens TaxID=615 RepID=UPI0018D62737|nr:helix-turn-helix domain-containing protein [Serratia marcescens]MDU1286101.1 YdaS family helix-turn-helix protein [Serratia marcescens]MDU1392620.1 YdaS family helix-turn-helix protein [Serratia marcescens]MDU5878071.1 YdaS family helix-turn-helix protein [Serratia marcescens]HEJ7928004.1 helix-turn-helix domain-containing protein [Serratia marcescens]